MTNKEALIRLVNNHFYLKSDGLNYNYVEGTGLAEVDKKLNDKLIKFIKK